MSAATALEGSPIVSVLAPSLGKQMTHPMVDIVVPVFNEQRGLEESIRRLVAYLRAEFPFSARVTIADNASTDATWATAVSLESEFEEVRAVHLDLKGRGRALRHVWMESDATVVAYMDVDLSTDLAALLPLVAPVISGHSDVAIGTRLSRSARVARGAKRELISRCYNVLLHATLTTGFSDAQCGFKAVRTVRAKELLPLVEDDAWFFDTELLVLAERSGLRIHEVPVDWIDDPDSRVDLVATARADLRGVGRLMIRRARLGGLASQGARFAAVGVASTVAYLVLYSALRSGMSAQVANAFALAITAVANTAANRRVTFEVKGSEGALRHHAQGLVAFLAALSVTSVSLGLLHLVVRPAHWLELTVLVGANLVATVLRFVLLRGWVFRGAGAARATSALSNHVTVIGSPS